MIIYHGQTKPQRLEKATLGLSRKPSRVPLTALVDRFNGAAPVDQPALEGLADLGVRQDQAVQRFPFHRAALEGQEAPAGLRNKRSV